MLTKKDLMNLTDSKIIRSVLNECKEPFDRTLKSITWSFEDLPLDRDDFLNMFLAKIPKLVREFNATKGISIKTFLCISLRGETMNVARSYSSNKYKILNNVQSFNERIKYKIPIKSLENELDYSVLTDFEYSVFLSLFEACKSIGATAKEHETSRYTIEQTLINIKSKMKKQLV